MSSKSVEEQIYDDFVDNVDNILEEIIKSFEKDNKSLNDILELEKNLNNTLKNLQKARQDLTIQIQNYNIKSTKSAINYYNKNILTEEELKESCKNYINAKKSHNENLQKIYEYIIEFQTIMSEKLSFNILIFYTSLDNAKIKLYSENRDDTVSSFLKQFNKMINFEDTRLSINHSQMEDIKKDEYTDIKALIELIKEDDKMISSQRRNALDNMEATYTEIIRRYDVNSNKNKYLILWKLENGWHGYKIFNKGSIEESRQRFLLQIHQKEIFQLFKNNAVVTSDKAKIKDNEMNFHDVETQLKGYNNNASPTKNSQMEIWINNYICSRYGIASVDNKSGLVIDDHVLRINSLLKSIQTAFGLQNNNKQYISIASKTTSSHLTGYSQFFKLVKQLRDYKDKKITLKDVKEYFKNDFFNSGSNINSKIEEYAIKDLDNIINEYKS